MIAIINAMEIENNSVLSLCTDITEKTISGKKFYEATLAGERVVCCLSGVAKVNAAISTTLLLEHFPVDCILNTGAAGGLKADENVLDCVISTRVVEHDYDTSPLDGNEGLGLFYDADPKLLSIAQEVVEEMNVPYHTGLIATGDQFITSESCKRILEIFPDSMCAEMEAGSIAHVASHYGVPFIIIRSLSDIAVKEGNDMAFNEYVEKAAKRSAEFCEKCVIKISKK